MSKRSAQTKVGLNVISQAANCGDAIQGTTNLEEPFYEGWVQCEHPEGTSPQSKEAGLRL